jgi:spore coat protein U-like protein
MNLFVKGALLAAVVAVSGATSAAAQNTDNDMIDVTAVVETALDVQGVLDLDFGPVFPGFGKTVNADAAGSGEFLIDGGVGGGVDITFSLPAVLTSGLNTMPVSFTAASGADRASAAAFDPTALHQGTLDGTSGELYVFLGGTVTAAATQVAGSYSGTVTMTATYNGL